MQEERSLMRKIFRRVYWENLSTVLILLGVFMLLQPFAMWMYCLLYTSDAADE